MGRHGRSGPCPAAAQIEDDPGDGSGQDEGRGARDGQDLPPAGGRNRGGPLDVPESELLARLAHEGGDLYGLGLCGQLIGLLLRVRLFPDLVGLIFLLSGQDFALPF